MVARYRVKTKHGLRVNGSHECGLAGNTTTACEKSEIRGYEKSNGVENAAAPNCKEPCQHDGDCFHPGEIHT